MATIILENAGETILLEGEAAEKYLAKKQAEKDAARDEYENKYTGSHNDINGFGGGTRSAYGKTVVAQQRHSDLMRGRTGTKTDLAAKYPDAVPKKLNQKLSSDMKATMRESNKQNERYRAEKDVLDRSDTPYEKKTMSKIAAADAKERHDRRHPAEAVLKAEYKNKGKAEGHAPYGQDSVGETCGK